MYKRQIETLLCEFEGLVILDEAYSDFSDAPSFLEELEDVYKRQVKYKTLKDEKLSPDRKLSS